MLQVFDSHTKLLLNYEVVDHWWKVLLLLCSQVGCQNVSIHDTTFANGNSFLNNLTKVKHASLTSTH